MLILVKRVDELRIFEMGKVLCLMKNTVITAGLPESQDELRGPCGKSVTYMVCDGTAKLIHPGSRLSNFLGGTDHI